jgi:hypothetical protein
MKKGCTHPLRIDTLKSTFFALMLVTFAVSCQTATQEKTEETSDSAALSTTTQPDLNSDQSALLSIVLGDTGGGVVRGITFGDEIAKIKATETFEMFEETPDHLGFTSETAQLESVDVQYFLTPDKKVNKIQLDVYLNSAEATSQLWNAGKAFFNKNYDSPKEEQKLVTWNKNAIKVQMEDMTKGKDFGLRFQFFPTNKSALALN